MKPDGKTFLLLIIFHIIFILYKFNTTLILMRKPTGRIQNGADFCDGVETLLSSTTLITLYYVFEQNIDCDIDGV